jgi:hypothetical protein
MVWGVDPWFLAALVAWACFGPPLAFVAAWRMRGHTMAPPAATTESE